MKKPEFDIIHSAERLDASPISAKKVSMSMLNTCIQQCTIIKVLASTKDKKREYIQIEKK